MLNPITLRAGIASEHGESQQAALLLQCLEKLEAAQCRCASCYAWLTLRSAGVMALACYEENQLSAAFCLCVSCAKATSQSPAKNAAIMEKVMCYVFEPTF